MEASYTAFTVKCSVQKKSSSVSRNFYHFNIPLSSSFKPILGSLPQIPLQIDVPKTLTSFTAKILDAFVDSVFEFIDHPLLPSQSNFAPVEQLEEAMLMTDIEGDVPHDFPEGVYVRNGPNPLFGGLKTAKSIFGRSSHVWVEGEGMLHALYFKKASDGNWTVIYKNRYVETETYKLEKQRNKPSFLPAIGGDSLAILSAYLLNWLRFGKVNKYISNTNVFEHSGKFYSIAENHIPQEIDIITLKTLRNWDINGAGDRPFISHPKKAPGTGELIIMGVSPTKPFATLGIISDDGKKLIHKVDIKLNRCSLCHEIGITQRFNVIMDFPLTLDLNRLMRGGPLIEYNKKGYARIGVMPRYGDANSIQWFEVKPNCTFHIINSFEDAHEVVVWGCRALGSVVPRVDPSLNPFEAFSRCYEWRLNLQSGEVNERDLGGTKVLNMDFPTINANFIGIKNRYGYTQVVDPEATYSAGVPKYGGLAKLYFEKACMDLSTNNKQHEEPIKVEYHMFEKNVFCTGASFVLKSDGVEEDDGWIITFIHNEDTDISQAHIIDTRKFSGDAVAKITIPLRVPYGFHGAFMPVSLEA
ncbi:hypothetical protein QN277_017525 [Acacia crassicarpa]|uniref:Carotenoid 9,10(9',10')-cleavage dioxygenase 1-like n=1 Tax=Acacia crassicarpa TaxID=499986 RepID=A0AAE1JTT6_9FABA|nr:hypothetical protein QN277_017525 [Acacia crassicarpa]